MGRGQATALIGGLGALALAVGAAAPVPRRSEPLLEASARIQVDTTARSNAPPRKPDIAIRSRNGRTRVAVADTDTEVGVLVDPSGIHVAVGATHDTTRSSRRAEVLAKMLRSDSSAEVRRIAAWGLNDYGESHAGVEALASALTSDSDASVREMAAWSLSNADDNPAAAAALVKALKLDKDAAVRATATWALGEVGDASAVDALVPMLSDASAGTREVAAWSIGSCEPKKAPAGLVSLLNDRSRDVRLSAAWSLYNIEDPDASSALEAAYARETDPEVRIGLIRALGAMGDRSVDVLQRLVTSSDPQVRKTAVTELAGGGASGPWPWPRPEPRPFPGNSER